MYSSYNQVEIKLNALISSLLEILHENIHNLSIPPLTKHMKIFDSYFKMLNCTNLLTEHTHTFDMRT